MQRQKAKTKIEIINYVKSSNSCWINHCQGHSAALLTDLTDEEKPLAISFDGNGYTDEDSLKLWENSFERKKDSNNPYSKDRIIFYSDKPLKPFTNIYRGRFLDSEYHCLANNCADAVKYAHDYFIEPDRASVFFQCLRCITCPITLCACCGCCSTFPLCCINTPDDVMKYAKFRLFCSGEKSAHGLEPEEKPAPASQEMDLLRQPLIGVK